MQGQQGRTLINLSRSAILQGFGEVVEELGLDARALVKLAGLPPECLDDPEARISTNAAILLLETTASRFGIADLGLRMAEKRRFSTLGAIGLAMREQPDVGSALRFMTDHFWSHGGGISMDFEAADGVVLLAPVIEHLPGTRAVQAGELCVAVICNLLRRFLGQGYRPDMVCFSHERRVPRARYARVFGDSVMFGQERTVLVVRAADLATPNPDADPAAAREMERYLAFVEGTHPADLASTVHDLIRQLLPKGMGRIVPVAARMGISRRTLHRQLAAQGTRFEDLVQQVRIELARDYLADGSLSMTSISELLGFAHLSGFSRWRRRWLGESGFQTPSV